MVQRGFAVKDFSTARISGLIGEKSLTANANPFANTIDGRSLITYFMLSSAQAIFDKEKASLLLKWKDFTYL